MENTDIQISPFGHLESFVNVQYDPWDFDAVFRTAKWSRTGIQRPILPAQEGTYLWKLGTRRIVFSDRNGNPLMALDEFDFPPMGQGEGKLLFPAKKNLLVFWFAP
jgi:hypothetical protein